MTRYSRSYVPVVESMPAAAVPLHGRQAGTGPVPTAITDVLTIGEEATVFRPVQRTLRPTGWAVVHANSLHAALAYLRTNVAAVAVVQDDLAGTDGNTALSSLRSSADAPEIVLVTWDKLPLQDAIRAGAFDVVQRPFDHSDLLWAVAAAWHNWMTQRERAFGGGPCSDA